MSGGVRLGAFGWGMHTVHGRNRTSKRRAFVVVTEYDGKFAVIFGRSEPRPGDRFELVSHQSEVGGRMGLRGPTFFTASTYLLPDDYEIHGFFAVELDDAGNPDVVAEHDLWLKLKALSEPP